jgi:hypothetical protein
MGTFFLQMIAVIALIYNAIMTIGLIVWLIKGFIEDRRQYDEE